MELAGDNKIWFYVLIMAVSFAYNVWKKKKKAQEVQEEQNTFDENHQKKEESVNFGLEDLISQFEEQYSSTNKEHQPEKVERRVLHSEVKTHEPQRVKETHQSKPRFTEVQDVSSHTQNKTGKKSDLGKKKEMESTTLAHENNELEMDLRQMIISKIILERPQH